VACGGSGQGSKPRTLAAVQLHLNLRQHALKGGAGVAVARGRQRGQLCQEGAQGIGANEEAAVLEGAGNVGLVHGRAARGLGRPTGKAQGRD
jgi:hypothetical protein